MNNVPPPWFSAILAALRVFLIAVGTLLAVLHYDNTSAYKWLVEAAGATMVVGGAAWGIWTAGVTLYQSIAVGVQAGINLTASGRAVTDDGKVISNFSSEALSATPPKQVTVATAKDIVKSFGPASSEIAKS